MNLSDDNTSPKGRNAGAVPVWGPACAAPAHPLAVGAVGFGPAWTMEDSLAASNVRLEQELEEANARIAVLEEEQRILAKGSGGDRLGCPSCGVAWAAHLGIAGTCQALRQAVEERDEAREAFAFATSNCVEAQQRVREMADQRDFAMGEMERVERERDEAREALREIQAAGWKTSGELRGMARKALEAAK